MKYRFKLLTGSHYENGKRYFPRDVIETDYPLDERFGSDRFELLSDNLPKDEDIATLEAKHVGFGRYKVLNKVTGEPIHEGFLSKDEANDMVG